MQDCVAVAFRVPRSANAIDFGYLDQQISVIVALCGPTFTNASDFGLSGAQNNVIVAMFSLNYATLTYFETFVKFISAIWMTMEGQLNNCAKAHSLFERFASRDSISRDAPCV